MATFTFRINDQDVIQKLRAENSISDVIRSALKMYYNTENVIQDVIQEEKAVIQECNTENENVIQECNTNNNDVIQDKVAEQLAQFEKNKSIIDNLMKWDEELFPAPESYRREYKAEDIIIIDGQEAIVKSVDEDQIIYALQSNPGKYKSISYKLLMN